MSCEVSPSGGLMEARRWVESGIVEEFDARQVHLLELVLEKVKYYYNELYRSAPRYRYPLSLSRLAKLCNRGVYSVSMAVRILANTTKLGESKPAIGYSREASKRYPVKRPFRIFLR